MFFEIVHQVVERFDIGVHAFLLRVGDEYDAVHSTQNKFAAGVVEDLAGDSVEMDPSLEPANRAEIQRQEIEKQSTVGLGGKRDHLALLLLSGFLINELQVRRLAA